MQYVHQQLALALILLCYPQTIMKFHKFNEEHNRILKFRPNIYHTLQNTISTVMIARD